MIQQARGEENEMDGGPPQPDHIIGSHYAERVWICAVEIRTSTEHLASMSRYKSLPDPQDTEVHTQSAASNLQEHHAAPPPWPLDLKKHLAEMACDAFPALESVSIRRLSSASQQQTQRSTVRATSDGASPQKA
ncbi:hypothetical protein VTN00DRAFT_5869 [Thermoascus crustaceus]|uniref:uncharacterized protein n=1 Tax=Thermoascus crustaceus TaxID=5088 RepID=UPI0037443D6A